MQKSLVALSSSEEKINSLEEEVSFILSFKFITVPYTLSLKKISSIYLSILITLDSKALEQGEEKQL